jgi:hypothetical protein
MEQVPATDRDRKKEHPMAYSTLPQAGRRPLRRLLGVIVVVAVALVVSLVLVLSSGGHTTTPYNPVLTHGPAITQAPDTYRCRVGRPC